jgi:hypothetical protein
LVVFAARSTAARDEHTAAHLKGGQARTKTVFVTALELAEA